MHELGLLTFPRSVQPAFQLLRKCRLHRQLGAQRLRRRQVVELTENVLQTREHVLIGRRPLPAEKRRKEIEGIAQALEIDAQLVATFF